jgi:hypothetical protein
MRALVIAPFLLSSCVQAKQIDFAAEETWLGPDESKTGRKLSFSGQSGIYIGTADGCVLPKTYNIDGSLNTTRWQPEWLHLQSLFDGSQSSGDSLVGPQLIGNISLVIKYHYNMKSIRTKLSYFSPQCYHERGILRDETLLSMLPSNIQIYVHYGKYRPEFYSDSFSGLDTRTFAFVRGGRAYCRIRLGVSGSDIKQSRIDVLSSENVVPQFSDAEAMDCIARGMFASVGYLGILRYQFDNLYAGRDLPKPGKPSRVYITPLLVGFSQYIESRILK